jgi:hypothetical protein
VQGVELETVEFFCESLESPQPIYRWLGRDWSSWLNCVQGVELEKVEFLCEALGSPPRTLEYMDVPHSL